MIFAYDLETTRIVEGSPELLYITAFGENFKLSMPITGPDKDKTFCSILETYFLLPEFNKAKFIAWNGNRFDAYFLAKALLSSDNWILQPYLTASKALRGLKVKTKRRSKKTKIYSWEFLDGISMTGIVGKKLGEFLKTFAPDFPKLNVNLEEIDFDPRNVSHVAYAERDSEGLYYGMKRVESIIKDLTDIKNDQGEVIESMGLKPTVGNVAINYLMNNVPHGTILKIPFGNLLEVLNGPVKRGGYCWCQRQYTGPVWKYDINQAYAAAMRDAELPAGDYGSTRVYMPGVPGVYEVIISRLRPSPVPFYYKSEGDPVGRFTSGRESVITWLTSLEIEHLENDGWNVEVLSGYTWTNSFNFANVVNRLEYLRSTDPQGSSGPLGTMVKALGNNAYGKTLEQLKGLEIILTREAPDGWDLYDPMDECAAFIFSRSRPAFRKKYHLPQIGVFITAHVRCKVRDAALLKPGAFLTADTDCVAFSEPVELDIDKTRYGAWKVEADGTPYIIVGKKIYYGSDGTVKAKGLHTRNLKKEDFENWNGKGAPKQIQLQRNNFLKFISGHDMFRTLDRSGTDFSKSKVYGVENGRYIPK